MAEYKALTYINLPELNVTKAPGDVITSEEFEQAGQSTGNIKDLIEGGALSKSMNAPLHEDHLHLGAIEDGITDSDNAKGGN